MTRTPVTSSQIASIGYDAANGILEIEFTPSRKTPDQPGSIYRYTNVPPVIYSNLIAAESIGKYFGENIKPYKDLYPYAKVS